MRVANSLLRFIAILQLTFVQAPKVNCYSLLGSWLSIVSRAVKLSSVSTAGVPETASIEDIRKAYLQRRIFVSTSLRSQPASCLQAKLPGAKSAHPDLVGSCPLLNIKSALPTKQKQQNTCQMQAPMTWCS